MNTLEYIQKAQAIHGDAYDYSKTIFTNLVNTVKVICPTHGEFEIRAKYHIYQKRGCQKCGQLNKSKALRMTTESFIEKAKAIHGDKYDYNSVNYIASQIKVDIICPLHGVFQQAPDSHLQNHGCPKCDTDRKKASIFSVDEITARFREVHGNTYDYSLINEYVGANDPLDVICKTHGVFTTSYVKHFHQQSGCSNCNGGVLLSEDIVIERFKSVHGDSYDYSKFVYVDAHTKGMIICPIHGEFSQTYADHYSAAHGCPSCAGNKKYQLNEIIDLFIKTHGVVYDYSSINSNNYKNITSKVPIICERHGLFIQQASVHINGSGCPKCSNDNKITTEKFIEKATQVHNGFYNYSKAEYISNDRKIIIICPTHGEFLQSSNNHINLKCGCPECAKDYLKNRQQETLSNEEFLERLISVHGDKYDYSKTNYVKSNIKVIVTCKTHGDFSALPGNLTALESGCPRCSNQISKAQTEIYEFVKSFDDSAILEDRESYDGLFLDIFIPNKKLVIEYNGCYWHAINNSRTTRFKKPTHLYDKMKLIQSHGLRVINIYEDEWINNRLQIEQIIKNALGVITHRIYARKCSIQSIETSDPRWDIFIKPFFNKYHHQGLNYKPNGIAYCLVYNKQIQACAYFGKTNYHNQSECELIRFATRSDVKVVGGLSKLIKNFLKCNPQVKDISSFCDARFFTGEGYARAGFRFISHNPPGFDVIIPDNIGMVRKHRSIIIKNKLAKYFSQEELQAKTQMELAEKMGWYCVPDCGQLLFKF